jgi:uncharacterized protein with GYD domain
MPRYVTLLRFTEKGAKALGQSAPRARAFRQAAAKAGVQIEAQLWTTGSYDGILILSADDERKVLGAVAKLAASGNVRTETLRAFDAAEFAKIVG